MKTLNYSIFINAPKEKVWDTMLKKATYEEWTKPFNPTSTFEGDWIKGSKMIFLGTDQNGENEGGMISRIKENHQYEYLSIEHLGMINKGVEELWGEDKNGFENYTFAEKEGGVEVLIEMTNIPEEYVQMMDDAWPKSLEILKELAEK